LVSSDFGFWKNGVGDPEEIFDDLAEGVTDALEVSSDVSWFRAELLSRRPELIDVLEPTEEDLAETPEDGAKYVLLTLPVQFLDHLSEILDMAKRFGLQGYSGVAGEPF
jgi:hypothetical protein